jgi:hypothetical protein
VATPWVDAAQRAFARSSFTAAGLRAAIIAVAVVAVWLAFRTDNRLALAGILAYLVLP